MIDQRVLQWGLSYGVLGVSFDDVLKRFVNILLCHGLCMGHGVLEIAGQSAHVQSDDILKKVRNRQSMSERSDQLSVEILVIE